MVSNIDIYVKDSKDKFILAEVYREKLGRQLYPQDNSLNDV